MQSIQELNRLREPKKLRQCRSCGLYLNQYPALDDKKESNVFWVGLSAVRFDVFSDKIPLSSETRSGGLIAKIESEFENKVSFYKTNLVKCLPLNVKTGKIRYPLRKEMSKCFPNLFSEIDSIKPKLVFLLGKQVSDFVLSEFDISKNDSYSNFKYSSYSFKDVKFIPVHHPSYVLVYKRKYLDDYINAIGEHIHSIGSTTS